MHDRRLGVDATSLESDVRTFVYRHFLSECEAPALLQIAEAFGLGLEEIHRVLDSLEKGHVLVLHPDTGEVWMAMSFQAVPTAYRVTAGGSFWWAN
jgi:hypothetical protein